MELSAAHYPAFKLVATLLLPLLCASNVGLFSGAQSIAQSHTDEPAVSVVKQAPLLYPPLARQTGIVGDVELDIQITAAGHVDTINGVKGHPLLQQAAIDSARQSEYTCNHCGDTGAIIRMLYSFKIIPTPTCSHSKDANVLSAPEREVAQTPSLNHITVEAPQFCTMDPAADITSRKSRSWKCLYLWKCAVR